MSEFIDSEAEESDDEEIVTKKRTKNHVDDDDDEEEEEDDEEKLREEMKDLINDEEEEPDDAEEEGDSDQDDGKRKRRHDDFDDALEEEDYDLIEENLGVKVQRKKQFKRLRRFEDDESDEEQEGTGGTDEREAIANDLFEGSDEGEIVERPVEENEQFEEISGSELESDEDDFIVDDNGQPISKGKKKRHVKYTDSALQEAQDIFGVDFDYQDFEKYQDEYEDENEEEEYEEEDDNVADTRTRPKKSARKQSTRKTIYDVFEPSELIRGHLTDRDNKIKITDIPERFQLRFVPVTSAKDEEIEEEAEWIYKHAFNTPTLSNQSLGNVDGVPETQAQPIGGRKSISAVGKIKEALKFMRNQQFEVPFIAFYRKEYVEPELKINDLWTVYKWDEKWCQLQSRKEKLVSLFHKMQTYQCDQVMKEPDKPLSDSMRLIDDMDFLKLGEIQCSEELRDAYLHLNLYHGQDIPAMQEYQAKEKRKKKSLKKTPNPNTTPNPNLEPSEGEDSELVQTTEDKTEEEEVDEQELTRVKHGFRKNFYAVCREVGLDGLAKKFGLTPEQFGENLRDNYQRHDVEQYPIEPSELAGDYTSKRFSTAEEVLNAARHMVALQISRDLVVRRCVRQMFFERAKICVKPTKKGLKDIDENHPSYSTKYLKNKPIKDLFGDKILKLLQAEKEGEIIMKIVMDKEGGTHSYLEEIRALYERDEFSTNVQEWNKQRSQALEIALQKFLYPTFERELRSRLAEEAREGIGKACRRKLYNWLKVAPYVVDQQIEEDEEFDTRDGIRVMALAYVPDRSVPAFCAVIDGGGDVTDYLRLPHILMRKNSWNEKERQLKIADMNTLKRFILTKKPHVIVVSGESREALAILDDVKMVVNDLVECEQFPPISVELMDNELAIVYMNTKKAESDFRDYPALLRQAVSLARRMQDPLAEFSQLCTFDQEVLCLKFHPMQNEVPKEELLEALYLEFINRTNEVGVDVNNIILHPHLSNLMQFVCGLGPRKASQILKILKQNQQRLESRTQLVTVCKMGPQVLINCAGFIKIDTSAMGDNTDAYLEVLDGSRVHPEAYDWARKMAVDALEYDDMSEDVNPAGALEEILENPEKLKDLDLDAFAEELERQGFGNKSIMLYDIRAELNHRYKDLRTSFKPPSAEETFNMLTKETPHTFYIGKLVLAHVVGIARRKPQGEQLDQANPIRNDDTGFWQCPFCLKNDFPELSEVWNHFDAGSCPGQAMGVRVRLDNGVSGFIPTKLISDKHVTNPEERVKMGMTISCRITKVNIDKFQVDLSCRSSDLADKNNEWRPPKDLYYDFEAEDKDKRIDEDQKKKHNRQTYVKRVIVHPSFHNINFKESEALLTKMDQGDLIIRPSSKGVDHLTVTWKVYENINQHIDVREEGKEKAFSLGQSLWIGNEEFEDLDEIIARYVQPMASYARDLVNFKYFVDAEGGKRDILEKLLLERKKKKPSEIPYLVSASGEFPGKFMLSYMPRLKPKHECITVTPEGFRYRSHQFHSTNSLFKWFKEHFRDPIPRTPQSIAARTPAGRSSAYIGATPNINLSNVDPQAIQRAAANLPSHVFSALSQVTGQTPSFAYGTAAAGASTPAAYSFQAYTPSQPIATPLMTPSYHTVATPAQSVTVTPRYPPQTPQNTWAHPANTPRTGGATPRQATQPNVLSIPAHHPKLNQRMPTLSSVSQPNSVNVAQATAAIVAHTTNPAKTPTATDWRRLAAEWAKKNQQTIGEGMFEVQTPRGGPSPMVESTPVAGDATPLIDEL